MKKLILLVLLVSYSMPCYAQTAIGNDIGFHPFRHLLSKVTEGAVGVGAGYGAYRYNQIGRTVIEQNAEPALKYWGTPSEDLYLNNIRQDLQHHKIMGKSHLIDAFARIVTQEPQYENNAYSIASSLGVNTIILKRQIERQRLLAHNPGLTETRTDSMDKSCHNTDFIEDRYGSGIAHGGHLLPYITETSQWMRGSQGNLALIPKQVADALRGHIYENFDKFRSDIWKRIGNDPILSSGFKPSNVNAMKDGKAPIALDTQHLNQNKKYNIHHKCPIHDGGGVYDFDNLVIVTPLMHGVLLNQRYHLKRGG